MAHDTHTPHDGPTVEMPRPTVWPMILSVGLTLLASGVAFGPAFVAVGLLLFVVGLAGWVGEMLPGRGHEHEPVHGPAPEQVIARPGTVEQLRPGAVGYRFRLPEKIHPISAGLKGGLVGGLVMPIPALLWGELSGHGIWFPVNLLAGMVLPGVDKMPVEQLEQFSPVLLAIGVVIHATISATIGLMYGVILPMLPGSDRGQLITGGVVVPLIWTGISHGMMGIVNPILQEYVDWYWFAVSQYVFGIAAAVVVVRTESVIVPPAGPHASPPPGPPRPPGPVVAAVLLAVLPFAGGCTPPGKPKPGDESKPPAAVTDFAVLYKTNCSGCHGANGDLGPAPPHNDPLFLAIIPDADLLKVVTEGRPNTPMPAFAHAKGGPLTEQQVNILANGLKKQWGKLDAAPPGTPPYLAPKSAGDAERGKAAFIKACAGCHGNDGKGGTFDGKPVGGINDPAFLALASDQRLRRIAITGRPDLGCPTFVAKTGRPADFQPLTEQEVGDLVALLASWRRPGLK